MAALLGALGRQWVGPADSDALVALGAEAVPALITALPRQIGLAAADVLRRLGPLAEEAVIAGASSPNVQVRYHCVRSLDDVAPGRATELHWSAWADADCGVRSAAHQVLLRRGVRFSPEQLVAAAERCPHGYDHVDVWAALHVEHPAVRGLLRSLAPLPRRGTAAMRILVKAGTSSSSYGS